ncbi:MAG TPA: hypothetical protein VL294_13725 [Pseudolysinimonas sp.]|nr:hypothetical protein [Pseudolysinimonas sp.]
MRRYRYVTGNRGIILAGAAAFGCLAAFVVAFAAQRADLAGAAFLVLWIAVVAWNAYMLLWRLCIRLDVEGDRLLWTAPLRSGETRVSEIVAIRPGLLGRSTVIALRDGRGLEFLSRTGVREFADALDGGRGLPVEVRVPAAERLSFRASAFEELASDHDSRESSAAGDA